jgi:AcrR family transcriptional regulator
MARRKHAAPWGGDQPRDAEEARRRLAMIAMDCFAERGMRKAFMAEVARVAGISRPTLYSYYASKESLIFGAMELEFQSWLKRQHRRITRYDTVQERLVEGVLYALTELPKSRVLKFIADPEYIHFVAEDDPGMERSLDNNVRALEPIFELAPELRERGREVAEIVLRTMTSFLQYRIGKSRSNRELRDFMHRTLVPAVGLAQIES